ncbi:MAG TPA: hypothetical protein VFO90_01415, partial [Terrimicrobiaceae bacterium]|nr:hypothetical protein [Terrimicrobiaceae bacterium]
MNKSPPHSAMTASFVVARLERENWRVARSVPDASLVIASGKRCEQVTIVVRVNIIGRISHRYECPAHSD